MTYFAQFVPTPFLVSFNGTHSSTLKASIILMFVLGTNESLIERINHLQTKVLTMSLGPISFAILGTK